jgi:hypothetical protein
METLQILELADHLLAKQKTEDLVIREKIFKLQRGIRALIHLCEVGHHVAAKMGLDIISPKIDEVVLLLNVERESTRNLVLNVIEDED